MRICVICVTVFFLYICLVTSTHPLPSTKTSRLKIANPSYSTPAEIKISDQEKKNYICV